MSGSIPLSFNSYNYLMKLQLLTPLMTLYSMTRIYSTKMHLTTTFLKTSLNQKTPPKSILQKPIKPKQLIPPKTQKTLTMKIHNRKTKNLNMKPIPQQLKPISNCLQIQPLTKKKKLRIPNNLKPKHHPRYRIPHYYQLRI